MLINAVDPEESRIAVVEDGVLQELHVEIASREAYLGNIYKGKVVNIEPSIGAAFVSFGGRINGFLHASDILPAYSRDDFQLIDVMEGRARATGEDGPDVVRAVLDDDDDEREGRPAPQRREKSRGAGAVDTDPSEGDADESAPRGAVDVLASDEGADDRADDRGVDVDAVADAGANSESGDPRADVESRGGIDADDGPDAPDRDERGEPEAREERDAQDDRDAHDDRSDRGGPRLAHANDGDDAGGETAVAVEGAAPAAVEAVRPRGRDRDRGRQGRFGARKPAKARIPIDQLLHKGQEVVVQITKEGIGAKGPTLTTYISLPGRCLVLMPSLPKCGVSRKIEDDKERRRLKKIVRELDETGNGGIGFIVRTAGIQKTAIDLERDRDYLKKIWELVTNRLQGTRAPSLLYQESDLVLKAMRDLFTPDIEEVVVDNRDVYLRIRDFAEKLMPKMAERIRLHEIATPIFHSFGIERDVENLFQPRVELPNGVSIVIDQAEALVAIDVNSGRFKPGVDLEETAYKTNLEAIPEIVRQLRLRDLGGVIIIDFIDMNAEKHRRGVERRLVDSLKGDRARIKVGRISSFGMMELTRQRVGPGLKRTVFAPCTHCKGTGLVRSVQSKGLAVLREVRAILPLKGFSVLQVYCAPVVHDFLVNYKRREVLDLEEQVGKGVVFRPEAAYPVDVVHYRFMTADGQEAKVVIPAGLGVKA